MAKIKVSEMQCPFCGGDFDWDDCIVCRCSNDDCETNGNEASPAIWFMLAQYYDAYIKAVFGLKLVLEDIRAGKTDVAVADAEKYLADAIDITEKECYDGFEE